jgi:hypothetical protein
MSLRFLIHAAEVAPSLLNYRGRFLSAIAASGIRLARVCKDGRIPNRWTNSPDAHFSE